MMFISQIRLLSPDTQNKLPHARDNTVQIVMNDTFAIIGSLAILMLVIAGLQYILARGNPEKVTRAKNMIMYSSIGLGIILLSSAIVNFVVERSK